MRVLALELFLGWQMFTVLLADAVESPFRSPPLHNGIGFTGLRGSDGAVLFHNVTEMKLGDAFNILRSLMLSCQDSPLNPLHFTPDVAEGRKAPAKCKPDTWRGLLRCSWTGILQLGLGKIRAGGKIPGLGTALF